MNSSGIFEDGTDRLSRNVRKDLPLYAEYCPRREQSSSISQRKPEIMHRTSSFFE
jgi:hypothetical protein